MRAAGVILLLAGGWVAAGCGAPITCPVHHTARKELLCPACSPDDPCECSEGWICREDPEYSEARRRQRLRAQEQREQSAQEAAQRQARQDAEAQRRRAEEQRLAEVRRLEEDARRREEEAQREREANVYPPPGDTPPTCSESCRGSAVHWTRFHCTSSDGRELFHETLECPAGLPPTTRGCPQPWRFESMCVPTEEPRAARCRAGPGRCCLPDGTIVRPCGPIGRPGCTEHTGLCGSGGFCNACRCLPLDALVLTPRGQVRIDGLHPGDEVITLTSEGQRVRGTVRQISAQPVVTPHEILVVRLDGGRVVRASGPHPLADGRSLDDLAVGDRVDGSRVVSVERAPYEGEATWDISVSGETGVYFVGGVPLGSTLGR